jgi:membrane protease YdiL (CAAX protease family)
MEQRLERHDIRLILVCAGLTLVSLVVGTSLFYDAFPEATIDFRITRDEARVRAASFLEHRGVDLRQYRHAALFRFDEQAKTFLERERGIEGASEVLGDPVRLWRWSNRWFRERQKEEFRVEHTTGGQFVGFEHLLPEDARGARLDPAAARRLAEQFLEQTLDLDLGILEFVEDRTTERPNRTDHSFTWKRAGFEVAGATYRYRVRVHGDLVGAYAEFLQVPEAWQQQYAELRSRNEATGLVAALFLVLTWIALLVRLVGGIRGQDIRWRTALIFGGIAAALTFLSQLNNLPVAVYGFDTTDTYSSFLTEHILTGLAAALAAGLAICLLVAGAEPEYRRWYGGHMSLSEQFLPDGLRTKRFLLGTIIGLTMTALFVAYQTLFYLVADHFGAWSPADIPYREMVNTHIPWVVILLTGFLPAVSEEFTSRAFSIPLLQRLLKHRWLAVVLSALVWGFAHAGYPQQPFWIRGLEVGLAGIAVGYVMIKWGLLPALVWHYTIDALYTALVLLRSPNPYFVLSAALSVGLMLIPLVVAVVAYARGRFFIDPVSLLNREDTQPLVRPPDRERDDLSPEAQILSLVNPTPVFHALRPARLGIAAAIVLAGLGVFLVSPPEGRLEPRTTVTGEAARLRATDHLGVRGVDTDSFRTVVQQRRLWPRDAVAYRHERAGPAAALEPFQTGALATTLWDVRFYRPGEREEWLVQVRPQDGSLHQVRHRLAEEAPGADLSDVEARRVAEEHLRDSRLQPERFVLKESDTRDRPARRDHVFVWEAAEGDARNLAEATYRVRVQVAGDHAASLERFVKLPEDWQRRRDEGNAWRTVLRWVPQLAAIAVGLHLLWLLIARIRSGDLRWRRPLWIGAVGTALFLAGQVEQLPGLFGAYPTQLPVGIYLVMRLVGVILGALFAGLLTAGVCALVEAMYPGIISRLSVASLAPQWRDAALLSALAAAAQLALQRGGDIVAGLWPEAAVPQPPALPPLDGLLPAGAGLLEALTRGLTLPLSVALVSYYATRVLRHGFFVVVAVLALGACLAGADAWSLPVFFYEWGGWLLGAAGIAAAIGWLYRDNIAAYVLTGFLTTAVEAGLLLSRQPAYSEQGWALLGLAGATLVAVWLGSLRAPRDPNPF